MKFKMLTGKADRRQYTRESADNSLSAGLYLYLFAFEVELSIEPSSWPTEASVFMELY